LLLDKALAGPLVACPPSSHNWLPCAPATCAKALNHNVCAALVHSSSITRCRTTTPSALSQPRRGWPLGGNSRGGHAPAQPPTQPSPRAKTFRRASLLAHFRGQSRPDRPLALRDSRTSRFEDRISCIGSFTETSFAQQLTSEASSPPTSVAADSHRPGTVESSTDSQARPPLRVNRLDIRSQLIYPAGRRMIGESWSITWKAQGSFMTAAALSRSVSF
jgi:hypothetical protein